MSYAQPELRIGILELFVEAARLRHETGVARGELQLRRARRLLLEKSDAVIRREERQRRRQCGIDYATRVAVAEKTVVAACPRCGGRVELRIGVSRPQHVGVKAGACVALGDAG